MDVPTISLKEGAADDHGGVGARGSLAKDAGLILAAGGVCLALALVVQTAKGQALFGHLQTLCAGLQGSGSPGGWAVGLLLFVGLGGLLVAAGVPRLWISAAAGAVYGAAWGSLWALAASLLGAMAVYVVGHTFLGGMAERRLGRQLAVWRERFRARAFWWVLYGRLFPLSNSTLLSLVCGSCRVPWKAYLAGSALGFVPLTLVFAVFGHGGWHGRVGIVALGFGLLGLTLGLRYLVLHLGPRAPASAANRRNGFPGCEGKPKGDARGL